MSRPIVNLSQAVTGFQTHSPNRFTGDEPRTSRGKGRFADRPRPDRGLRPEKKAWAFSPKNSRNGRHYTECTKGVTGGATRGRVKAVSRKHVRRMWRPAMRSERRMISTKDGSGSGREKGGPRGGKLSSISRRFRDKPRKRAREISEAGRVKGYAGSRQVGAMRSEPRMTRRARIKAAVAWILSARSAISAVGWRALGRAAKSAEGTKKAEWTE